MWSLGGRIPNRCRSLKQVYEGSRWRSLAVVGAGLSLGAVLPGCDGSSQVHTLKLEVTDSAGDTQKFTIRGETSWEVDSLGVPFASWPDMAEWGVDTKAGVSMGFYPFQPGTYASSNAFLILDGQVDDLQQLALIVHTDKVKWTGKSSFPFQQEGRFETSPISEGPYRLKGSFTTSSDNCTNKIVGDSGCGSNYPTEARAEQTWDVANFTEAGTCPTELVARYVDGKTLVINPKEAYVGSAKRLECIITYQNSSKSICGASEDSVEIEGRTWGIAAMAFPGNSYLGDTPYFGVYAGTLDDDANPLTCWIYSEGPTPISGTGL